MYPWKLKENLCQFYKFFKLIGFFKMRSFFKNAKKVVPEVKVREVGEVLPLPEETTADCYH